MMRIRTTLKFGVLFAMTALLGATAAPAADGYAKSELKEKNLAQLEESARTEADYRELARMYDARAEMLEEKIARHEKLEQRYASAPKSLIQKRGHAWNTPHRQARLADKARQDLDEARNMARQYLAKADGLTTDVD